MRAYALMPGLLLVCCGLWAHEKTVANAELALGSAVAMAVLATIGTKIQLRTAEGFQKQIDALDALGSSGDNAKA